MFRNWLWNRFCLSPFFTCTILLAGCASSQQSGLSNEEYYSPPNNQIPIQEPAVQGPKLNFAHYLPLGIG